MTTVIITFGIALLQVFVIENSGYLGLKIIKKILKYDRKSSLSFFEHFFVGLLLYAMIFFVFGLFGLISKPLVLIVSGLLCTPILLMKRNDEYREYVSYIKTHRYAFAGTLVYFILGTLFTYRPIAVFDALWYHIPITKQFLQDGNIAWNGEWYRYTVHPYLNFFWQLFPLSFPISTPLAGITINWFQHLIVGFALYNVAIIGNIKWGWSRLGTFLSPTLMGITTTGMFFLGAGYNDLYGFALGIVATSYVVSILSQKSIDLYEIIVAILLIITLGLIKIFFGVFGFFLLLLLFTGVLQHHKKSSLYQGKNKIHMLKPIGSIVVFGLLFVVPWLVRSYYYTGHILYPVGADWLEQDVLNFSGAFTLQNYWYNFFWDRLFNNIFRLGILNFNPIAFIGLLGIGLYKNKKWFSEMWLLSLISLSVLIFLSIVFDPRYVWAPMGVFMILGITAIEEFTKKASLFIILGVWLVPVLFIVPARRYALNTDNLVAKLFINGQETPDEYLSRILISNQFVYYPSKIHQNPQIYPKMIESMNAGFTQLHI